MCRYKKTKNALAPFAWKDRKTQPRFEARHIFTTKSNLSSPELYRVLKIIPETNWRNKQNPKIEPKFQPNFNLIGVGKEKTRKTIFRERFYFIILKIIKLRGTKEINWKNTDDSNL